MRLHYKGQTKFNTTEGHFQLKKGLFGVSDKVEREKLSQQVPLEISSFSEIEGRKRGFIKIPDEKSPPPPFEKVPGGNQKSIGGPLKRKSLVLYFCVIVQEREKILVL